jgi:hypothetical protein
VIDPAARGHLNVAERWDEDIMKMPFEVRVLVAEARGGGELVWPQLVGRVPRW